MIVPITTTLELRALSDRLGKAVVAKEAGELTDEAEAELLQESRDYIQGLKVRLYPGEFGANRIEDVG